MVCALRSSPTRSARRRARPAASCCYGTAARSGTSRDETPPPRRTASSSSSTIPRSGSWRTTAMSSRSSTRTSPRRRARHGPTSKTSGCGPGAPTWSIRSRMTIWPPSGSKTARSNRCRLRRNAERAAHTAQVMRVALVGVAAGLELDRPSDLALEGHTCLLVQTGAEKMEVVDRGLVLDLDLVRPRFQLLHVLAGLGDLDREARADLTLQDGYRRLRGPENESSEDGCCGDGQRELSQAGSP